MPKGSALNTTVTVAVLGSGSVLGSITLAKKCKLDVRYKPGMTSEQAAQSLASALDAYLKCIAKGFRPR